MHHRLLAQNVAHGTQGSVTCWKHLQGPDMQTAFAVLGDHWPLRKPLDIHDDAKHPACIRVPMQTLSVACWWDVPH